MKRISTVFVCALLLVCGAWGVAPNAQAQTQKTTGTAVPQVERKRAPIFRPTKEQIKQAQTMLKQRGLYGGDVNGKLDADTRAGLKKYQEGEGLKATGTLNRATLEKMNITLTDKQKLIS
ncbi:MAG TPA: peptidoglycan-binding domain-containing protein [Pyrinomonadaceae bacterium]|nr:peptidoglycan-binding domain-containing protein [Pyrinomonadaceae bacterium]